MSIRNKKTWGQSTADLDPLTIGGTELVRVRRNDGTVGSTTTSAIAALGGGGGGSSEAADITIADVGNLIAGTTVEAALAENRTAIDAAEAAIDAIEADYLTSGAIGTTVQPKSANLDGWAAVSEANYYTSAEVDSAIASGGSGSLIADLASTANGDGASMIGVEDAGGYYTGTTVEAALAELGAAQAGLTAVVVLKGTWDASSGSFPGSGAAQAGWSYIVSTGGTVDGVTFTATDRIVAIVNSASTSTYAANWHKLDYTDQVLSVAGRTGDVTIAAADITDATANGRALIQAANYAAMRALLDLEAGSDFYSIAAANAAFQAASATLTSLASASANGVSLATAADYAAMRTLLGLVIGTNVAAYDAGADGAAQNRITNGCMRVNQRAITTVADDQYCLDRWYALTQTGTVGVGQQLNIEGGWPYALRLTQSQATAQRMGIAQIIEAADALELRGQAVTLSARVQISASGQTVRYAILEWTGTADSVTSDVVNSWTSGTYTAGNFFIGSVTVTATGSTALTASTPATVTLAATIGGSANNLIVVFWTSGAQAQSVTLDIGKVQLKRGSAVPFGQRRYTDELYACRRHYTEKKLSLQSPAAGDFLVPYNFDPPMRTTPVQTNKSPGSAGAATITQDFGSGDATGGYFQINASVATGFVINRVNAYSADL